MISNTSKRAERELLRIDTWWRENRDHKDVFIDEFESMVKVIEEKPHIGRVYRTTKGKEARYVLMRKTRYHIFYFIKEDEIEIVSVWGAERARGPKL